VLKARRPRLGTQEVFGIKFANLIFLILYFPLSLRAASLVSIAGTASFISQFFPSPVCAYTAENDAMIQLALGQVMEAVVEKDEKEPGPNVVGLVDGLVSLSFE
jgi:hypothetical protein